MEYYKSTKRPGNISSAFTSDNEVVLSQKYIELKLSLKPVNIEESWAEILKEFRTEIKTIHNRGSNIIPQIDLKEIQANNGKFPKEKVDEIKKRGCVVVRNVVERDIALQYKKDVQEYIARHRSEVTGFPENDPQVWEIYWSKSQTAARSHSNFNTVTSALNQLWHADAGTSIDLTTNVTYCDRLRIRKPGDTSFALGEHIDGGSLERFEDLEYRQCYSNILSGNWKLHDPFDATHRVKANMDMYNCSGGCSMFRTFQGWMSLSDVKPGGGTLRVCPLLKLTTAYVILRPFLKDLEQISNMAGAFPGVQQNITKEFHPDILDAVVSVPQVTPGDCVFWHCDCVHAVEAVCKSEADSSVLYIPATPLCKKSVEYLLRQRKAFEVGGSPPDFPLNNSELGFEDRAKESDLTALGLQGMGFMQFTGNSQDTNNIAKDANKILFQ